MALSNRSRLSYKLKFAARHPGQIVPYARQGSGVFRECPQVS